MIKKLLIFSIAFFIGAFSLTAQSLIRQSLSCLGSSYSTDGVLLRQTIGQPSNTFTFNGEGISLRQGFQQPLNLTEIKLDNELIVDLRIYPNPFTDYFNILIIGNYSDYQLEITDITGRITKTITILNNYEQQIICNTWKPGMYFVNVLNKEKITTSFKIIKTQ